MLRLAWFPLLFAVSVTSLLAAEAPNKFEPDIVKFETQDADMPPVREENLFVGSSSVRMWKLQESFPEHTCLNRGFGGSKLSDVVHYIDRIVLPYSPKVIVLYAGDNDIGAKRPVKEVHADYLTFVERVRAKLPETKIVWVAIKPSPKRWAMREEAQAVNEAIRTDIAAGKGDVYVDIWGPMLGDDGMPRTELYLADGLHLTPAGYAVWNKLVEPHLVK